jgi:hypothetical protein
VAILKKVNNADAGDADTFGGDDIDKVADYFNGVSVTGAPVRINTQTQYADDKLELRNPADTFSYVFSTSAITSANKTVTFPLLTADDTLVFANHSQTLTNKTLTSPVISTISNTGTLTLPTSTDTMVGRATTDTLTNKTLTTPTLTTPTINGAKLAQQSKTENYTMLSTDYVVRCDASGGGFTITLPTASGIAGAIYTIIRTDVDNSTNIVTVDANGSQTIDGMLTWRLYTDEKLVIMSDGSNWVTIQRENPDFLGSFFLKGSTANRRYVGGILDINASLLTSTTAPAANTLWALPIFLSKTVKVDTISFEVTTSQSSQNSRVGIYTDNGNAYPSVKLFDSGNVSTGTTGVKNTTVSPTLILQPGLYWLTYITSSTTHQIRILPGASTCVGFGGYASTMGTTGQGYAYSVAHTFGTLPDPFTGSATLITTVSSATSPIPAVGIRIV